ncbi:gluconokinase [Ketogulonicigenium vulgare]|uniref:gluconokinase n=1 Tax=Ketogulonicigenium vulgare TaxID=92945 RepID=UPI002358416E|nr:gluconokinase [Ketogulonicigenium vulgare]
MSTAVSLHLSDPPRIVLMGVSGCGKSSVGAALSALTGVPYQDADDLHPSANVEKMRAGIALTDDDRWPWLTTCAEALAGSAGGLILGCSALKRIYRDHLRGAAGRDLAFVHLIGTREVILERMRARVNHYMPVSLLDSQFATLEPPGQDENAMAVSIDVPPAQIAVQIRSAYAWQGLQAS